MAVRSTALILALVGGCAGNDTAFDRTAAALRAGDLNAAEAAARELAERYPAWSDFLRGNAVFARCELAARQAVMPEAEPFAFDVAINYGKRARDLWQRAAMSRPDWPAARRNVERALLKLDELERLKAEADERRRRDRARKPEPRPQPQPKPDPQPEQDPTLTPHLTELAPDEVLRLLEKLAEKEQEKLAVRRARRQKSFGVERDW